MTIMASLYLSTSVFSTNKTDLLKDDWNIAEIDILHHTPTPM